VAHQGRIEHVTNRFQLNVSRLGYTSAFNTSDGDGGLLSTLINDAEGILNSLISNVTSEIAQALNLSDFYSVHLMDYCQGSYEPNATASNAKMNVSHCSSPSALFHFDPTAVVSSELPSGVNLTDLQWPSEVEDAARAIKVASMVMVIFYIIGIVFAGLAVVGALVTMFTAGRLSACINFMLNIVGTILHLEIAYANVVQLAFLTLGIASAIATTIIVKAVNAINKYGDSIGLAAYKGGTFLAMTWAATAVMLLAAVTSIVQCCTPRRRSKDHTEKGY